MLLDEPLAKLVDIGVASGRIWVDGGGEDRAIDGTPFTNLCFQALAIFRVKCLLSMIQHSDNDQSNRVDVGAGGTLLTSPLFGGQISQGLHRIGSPDFSTKRCKARSKIRQLDTTARTDDHISWMDAAVNHAARCQSPYGITKPQDHLSNNLRRIQRPVVKGFRQRSAFDIFP